MSGAHRLINRRTVFGAATVALLGGAVFFAATPKAAAQAPSVNVSGTWVTQFAGAQAIVSLTQAGQHVTGQYVNTPPLAPGALAGVMRGNVLVGRWTDATSSGGFTLLIGADGRSFAGTWGRVVSSTTNGGPWIGQRQ